MSGSGAKQKKTEVNVSMLYEFCPNYLFRNVNFNYTTICKPFKISRINHHKQPLCDMDRNILLGL